MTSSINNISNSRYSNQYIEIISPSEVGQLGKNDFLTMIITQLQNQDPLNPLDNSQFITQLAQFSTLEQMSNMSSQLNSLGEISEQLGEITKLLKENNKGSNLKTDTSNSNSSVPDNTKSTLGEYSNNLLSDDSNSVTLRYDFSDSTNQIISQLKENLNTNKLYSDILGGK